MIQFFYLFSRAQCLYCSIPVTAQDLERGSWRMLIHLGEKGLRSKPSSKEGFPQHFIVKMEIAWMHILYIF